MSIRHDWFNHLVDCWVRRLTHSEIKIIWCLLRNSFEMTSGDFENCISSKTVISSALSSLKKKKLINEFIYEIEHALEIIKSKTPQVFPKGNLQCFWCNTLTCILHNHHFPISKKHEGNQTIKICANCHNEFHHLTEVRRYRINEEIFNAGIEVSYV